MEGASLAGSIQVMPNRAANIAVVASGAKEASRLLEKSGNPPIPSFPRRRESTRLSGRVVTPRTKVGEAWCMGAFFSTLLRLLQKPHVRHSREGGNLCSISGQDWMPAFGDLRVIPISPLPPRSGGRCRRQRGAPGEASPDSGSSPPSLRDTATGREGRSSGTYAQVSFAGMTRTGRSRVRATASVRADPAWTRRPVAGSAETLRTRADPFDRRRVPVRHRLHHGAVEDC